MNITENFRLAVESIRVNKMRSVLTMLGIIIGISSVITITTIGSSLKATIASSLSSLGGTNLISCYVNPVYPDNDEDWETWVYPEMTEGDYISLDEVKDFKDTFDSEVKDIISTIYIGTGKVTNSDKYANVEVMGSTGGVVGANAFKILAGRDITLNDALEDKSTAIVSDWFVKYAYGGISPIGEKISIETEGGNVISAYVVGIYKYDKKRNGKANSKEPEKDIATELYVSYPVAKQQSIGSEGIEFFDVVTKDGVDPTALKTKIQEYFYNEKFKEKGEFQLEVYDMASELGIINQVLNVITIAISVIAAISLLVGGIGVMNIMLVSVVERTREIGIRKALGAKPTIIKKQFLTEAIVICLIGGGLGIIFGLIFGYGMTIIGGKILEVAQPELSGILDVSFRPSLVAILISVAFSMVIGLIFGSYPAKRAASLNPIDALRYE